MRALPSHLWNTKGNYEIHLWNLVVLVPNYKQPKATNVVLRKQSSQGFCIGHIYTHFKVEIKCVRGTCESQPRRNETFFTPFHFTLNFSNVLFVCNKNPLRKQMAFRFKKCGKLMAWWGNVRNDRLTASPIMLQGLKCCAVNALQPSPD